MTGSALDAHVIVERRGFRLDAVVQAGPGETVAVMGPSGAGKSTLLGALAGLVTLDGGHMRLGDRMLDSARPRAHVTPSERSVVLLGQEPRLFPHLTAHGNVAFGLLARGAQRAVADAQADQWMLRVGLAGLGDRRPSQLSGGQQQRVAIARALATKPAAVLLDEPLTFLDLETAGDIRAMLRDQLSATHTTAVVATHDAVDAVSLAHRLVVVEDGRITQSGPVRDVLASPATRFTAAVAGLNRVVGAVQQGRWKRDGLEFAASVDGYAIAAVFPPTAVHLDVGEALAAAPGEWLARVVRLEQTPAGVRVRTAEPEVTIDLTADRAAALGLTPGLPVRLRVDLDEIRLLPALDSAGASDPTFPAR
jgi:molybdate transport system ATP-binding protein